MNELTIKIVPYSEGGYYYDIYTHEHGSLNCAEIEECDSEDGGLCTSTLRNALVMATQQAQDLIKRKKTRNFAREHVEDADLPQE